MPSPFHKIGVIILITSPSAKRCGNVTARSRPEFQLDGTCKMELRSHVKSVYR
jgi:hypothetical protein